jgi:hypothetical protein
MEFPKWKFHKTSPATIVQNADEESALGSGWKDEPHKNGTTEVDPAVNAVAPAADVPVVTDEQAFQEFLAAEDLTEESDEVKALFFKAFTAKGNRGLIGAIPQIEVGRPVGPQDNLVMVDSEEARKALLAQAKEMGVEVHHASGSKTIQAAIDAFVAAKSSTPAAMPKDTDLGTGGQE